MNNLVKTTITLPEDLLQTAKLVALQERKTLSALMREAVNDRVYKPKMRAEKKPMRFMGVYKLGIKKIYNKRSDLYDEHLKRKMGI